MPNRGQTPSTSVPLAQLLAMSNDHLARPSRMLNDYIDPYEAVCTKKNKMRRSIAETVCPAGWARRWRDFPSRSYLTSIDKVLTKTRSCVSYDTDITQVLTWVTVDLNMVCVVWRGVGWCSLQGTWRSRHVVIGDVVKYENTRRKRSNIDCRHFTAIDIN